MRTTRPSAKARPLIPAPTGTSTSSTGSSAGAAATAQSSGMLPESTGLMRAASASSRRFASSTVRCTTALGSRSAAISALMAATVACVSTRRSSSAYSRALVTAMAAWPARMLSTSPSASAKASGCEEWTVSVPSAPRSPMSGAAITERMSCCRTNWSDVVGVAEAVVGRVVAGAHHAPVGERQPGDALVDVDDGVGRGVGDRLVDVGGAVRPRQHARLVGHQVDAAAVRAEQARRLVHRALEEHVRVADGGDLLRDAGHGALRLDEARQVLRLVAQAALEARLLAHVAQHAVRAVEAAVDDATRRSSSRPARSSPSRRSRS